MQERPPYKITPDQAWAQMRPILDKAMPVEPRSRRYIVLWWLAGIVLLASLLSIFLLREKPAPVNIPPTSSQPTEMAKAENKELNHQNQQTSNLNTNASENSSTATGQKSPAGFSLKFDEKSSASSHSNNSYTSHLIKETSVHQQVSFKTDAVVISDQNSATGNNNENNSAADAIELNTIDRNNSVAEFLPLAEQVSLESKPAAKEIMDHNFSPSIHKRQPFHPNASIAGLAGSQNGLGANFSTGTEYVISSKFSISGSVGYSSYHPEALNLGLAKDDALTAEAFDILKDAAGIGTYIPEEDVNAAADYNAISPLIHSIQQWQVRMGIKYSLSGRFFVDGGYILGFATTAKSEYPIVSTASAGVYSGAKSSFNSYDVINSTTSSIYAGVGYRLSRHFEIFSDWTHGLDHYLLNEQNNNLTSTPSLDERDDYIRGLSLGIRYQL